MKNRNGIIGNIMAAGLVLWALFVYVKVYGWGYGNILNVLGFWTTNLIPELCLLFYFILLSFAIGGMILSRIGIKTKSLLDNFLLSTGMGFGIIGVLVYLMAHLGILYKWVFIVIFFGAGILLWKRIWQCLIQIKNSNKNYWNNELNPVLLIALFCLVVHLFLGLALSLTPEVNTDATAYHLALPNYYIMNHRIVHMGFMFYGEWPHLSEMLNMVMLIFIKSSVLCKLLQFTFFSLSLMAIYSIARAVMPAAFAIMASAVFASIYRVLFYLYTTKEEFFLTFFSLLCFMALVYYIKNGEKRWLIPLALYSGFTIGCKLLFGLVPVFCIFVIVVWTIFRKKIPHITSSFLKYILIILAFSSIWYMRQIVYYGEPFYPISLLTITKGDRSAIGSLDDPTVNVNQLVFRHNMPKEHTLAKFVGHVVKGYFLFPWRLTADEESFAGVTSIFFIVLLPGILLVKRPFPEEIKYGLLYGLLLLTCYFFSPAEIGRYFPLFAILSVICVYILANLITRLSGKIILIIVSVTIIVFTILNIRHNIIGGFFNQAPVALGIEKRGDYLKQRTYGVYETAEYINRNLTQGTRLFLFPLITGFYIDRLYVWGDPAHADKVMRYDEMKSASDLLSRLNELGITYILVDTNWKPRANKLEPSVYQWVDEVIKKNGVEVFNRMSMHLYHLRDVSGLIELKEASPSVIDKHEGFAGGNPKNNIYKLEIKDYSKDRIYKLIASTSNPIGDSDSNGDVLMKKEGEETFVKVGSWRPSDVTKPELKNRVRLEFDITPYLKGDGGYVIFWKYTEGQSGIYIHENRISAFTYSR